MTDHTPMNEMDAAPEGLNREHRDMALSRARHCIEAAIEELHAAAIGDPLPPGRAYITAVALEEAGDTLEDLLEGLYG
ncbi:hypothetical protein HOP61_17915 [Halomonas daqingensis]|uniref:Uncharacterized protein n=1 Tax=Billgrantia desiderata TaxID=52021 RepID=A0AAW4YYZ1_9GAMM|nr:hypothetical protein [Halomonas desiderata]MCE8053171.1 hypothetical protein [Halomonas desiderata]